MFENWHWQYMWGIACFINYAICIFMMGMTRFRHGEIAKEATEQAMTVNQANIVNAKANTFKYMQVDVALNDDAFALAA